MVADTPPALRTHLPSPEAEALHQQVIDTWAVHTSSERDLAHLLVRV